MSRELVLHTDDGVPYSYENIRTQGWLDGHKRGLEFAAGWLRERAVELFRCGLDEKAKELRELATKMETTLGAEFDQQSSRHRTEHPEMMVVLDPPRGDV